MSNSYSTLVGEGCPVSGIRKTEKNRNNINAALATSGEFGRERVKNIKQELHMDYTENEKIVPPMFYGSRRPKIWLRRAPANLHHAIREYILNKRTQAAGVSLANLKRLMGQWQQ